MKKLNEIKAVFHIGRGGRFNNQGYITFRGEMTIDEMERLCTDKLFTGQADGDDEYFKNIYVGDIKQSDISEADFETREFFGVSGGVFLDDKYSIGDADERKTAIEAAKFFGEKIDIESEEEREDILCRLFEAMDEKFEELKVGKEIEALQYFNENLNRKYYDCSGNVVGEIGGCVLDFDGEYDTLYATDFGYLTKEEIEAVKREDGHAYISDELRAACGL